MRRPGQPSGIVWLGMTLALMGCLELPSVGSTDGGGASRTASGPPLPQSLVMSSAGIEVGAPPGYCLDQEASSVADSKDFAAFRRCSVLRGQNVDLGQRALLTVSVSETPNVQPVIAGSEARLIAFFDTVPGRKVLSRSGNPATVKVLASSTRGGVVWLKVSDSSDTAGLDSTYWRAIFDAKGRIVTVTAAGYAKAPMSSSQVRSQASGMVARIQSANPIDAVTRAGETEFNGFLIAVPPV